MLSMISCTATVPYRNTEVIDAYVRAPIVLLNNMGKEDATSKNNDVVAPLQPASKRASSSDWSQESTHSDSLSAQDENKLDDSKKKNTSQLNAAVVENNQDISLRLGLPPPNAVYEPRLEIGDQLRVSFYQRPVVQKEAYLINPNDILRVDVLDHPELSRDSVLVLPDGYISVPLADRIQASGKSTERLGFEIGQRLNDHKISDPIVNVAVQRSQSVLVGLMEMLQARDGREPLTYIVDGSGTLDLPLIEPVSTQLTLRALRQQIKAAYLQAVGPLLEVSIEVQSARPLTVYVVGEVSRPGSVTFENGLHPLMAVSGVGGFLPTADLSEVRMFRVDAKGQLHQWRIDMASEDELFSYAVKLLPRDILFVPRTGIAEANQRMDQYVRRLLPFTLGVGANYDLNNE